MIYGGRQIVLSEFRHLCSEWSNLKCFISIFINILDELNRWIVKICKFCKKERNKNSISSATATDFQLFEESKKTAVWFSSLLSGDFVCYIDYIWQNHGEKDRYKFWKLQEDVVILLFIIMWLSGCYLISF